MFKKFFSRIGFEKIVPRVKTKKWVFVFDLFVVMSVLSIGTLFYNTQILDESDYYAEIISDEALTTKEKVRLGQTVSNVNFLQNNDFNISFYFCYQYTNDNIKTFFSAKQQIMLSETKIDTSLLFSPSHYGHYNESLPSGKYMGLVLKEGASWDFDWSANQGYVSESFFNQLFPNSQFNPNSDYIVNTADGLGIKVVGIFTDDSATMYNEIYGDFIYVSYQHALTTNLFKTQVQSLFLKNDIMGASRYLKFYFKLYLDNDLGTSNEIFLETKSTFLPVERNVRGNWLLPLLIAIVCLGGTAILCHLFFWKKSLAWISTNIIIDQSLLFIAVTLALFSFHSPIFHLTKMIINNSSVLLLSSFLLVVSWQIVSFLGPKAQQAEVKKSGEKNESEDSWTNIIV